MTYPPTKRLGRFELVALLAMLMGTFALSTDSILPGMTAIDEGLRPADKSYTQYLISGFMFGGGFGMMFFGVFADSFGRRKTVLMGMGLYILTSFAAAFAPTLEVLIALRVLQGIGASSARIVSQAVTRDLFAGPEQARVNSLIFMVFILIPAIAPLLGQQIIWATGWRGLFSATSALGVLLLVWFLLRQPETLAPEYRRDFRLRPILAALREVLTTPVSVRYLFVQVLMYGQFIAYLASAEQLWVDAIGVGDQFPLYFAVIAIISAGAGFINSRLVMRLGMRRMLLWAFGSQAIIATIVYTIWSSGLMTDAPYVSQVLVFGFWSTSLVFINGLTLGNVTALAMEPLGHVAGTGAALLGALGMMGGMLIAMPVGQAFDGTPRPIILGAVICSILALALVLTDMQRKRA